jgi:hypothetical protein
LRHLGEDGACVKAGGIETKRYTDNHLHHRIASEDGGVN